MGRQEERPVRRTVAAACGALLAGTCILAAGVFAFLGQVLHPVFFWFTAFIAVTWAAVGVWAWRDLRRTDRAMAPIEDTMLVDLDAIARPRPVAVPARHPFTASLWRQLRRGRRRVKEGAQSR